jgi:Lon protease-like protein
MSGVELPTIIPVFPLPNVVLFPDVMLPLHIFEPRYRQMVRETSEKTPPLIGMALLRGNWQEQYEGRPEIFPVCCAGEMARVAPLADGRFNIMLRGVRECRLKEEVYDAGKLYRQFVVEWLRPEKQTVVAALRQDLKKLLDAYLQKNETVQKFLNDPTVEDEFFVNFFAFHLDLLPIEKQSLLEAGSLAERATLLRDMLDFKLTEGRWAEGGGPANKPRLH